MRIAVGGMHRRSDMHERPETFDPDRWRDPAAERLARPFANLVFGGGPRMCIGMRLAQVEFKAIVARTIARYDLAPADATPVAHGGMWIARPSRAMRVTLAARWLTETPPAAPSSHPVGSAHAEQREPDRQRAPRGAAHDQP